MKRRAIILKGCRRICTVLFAISILMACQSSETTENRQEQLNNNASGMDRDHTAAPPDTVAVPDNINIDSTGLSNSQPLDTAQRK